VTFPAFKAGDSALREPSGEFDSHTLPPIFMQCAYGPNVQIIGGLLDLAAGRLACCCFTAKKI